MTAPSNRLSNSRRMLCAGLAVAALTAATLLGTGAAQAAEDYTAAEQALAAHEGISPQQARAQFVTQNAQSVAATEAAATLGADESAGSYIDDAGRLVVAVTSAEAAAKVPAGTGAAVEVVARSEAELDAQASRLDEVAAGAPGIASWGVDPRSNSVVVEVIAGAADAATTVAVEAARAEGATVVEVGAAPTVFAPMVGGEQFEFREGGAQYVCSVGFPARTASGQNAMVTAGHCADGATSFTFKGASLGTPIGSSFPGDDYAAFTLAGSVTPRGAVSTWNGGTVSVAGAQQAAVGAAICKSGRTTGWTCGTLTGKNRTVNYSNGDGSFSTVSGLIATSACTEGGDSGGSNVAGSQAQAVTSGGAGYDNDGNPATPPVCGEKVGQANQSYVQPVGEILQRYGLTLLTNG